MVYKDAQRKAIEYRQRMNRIESDKDKMRACCEFMVAELRRNRQKDGD